MALVAYRHVLRSASLAFKGDERLLRGAHAQARHSFEQARDLAEGSKELQQAIQHAEDVAHILRENVVQGQADNNEQYKLRMHKHIERGDNESIKIAGKRLKEKSARP